MTLLDINEGEDCIVKDVTVDDDEVKSFLFTLGCYSGETISVISRVKGGCVVMIKDARYNIDSGIAEAIVV